MFLQDYIAKLLKEHNCVIVPDFGGFVANYRSAVVDEFRKKIHPPAKSVLFNTHLTSNDGLLGNYVSQQRSVDYLSALNFISEEVKNWNSKMNVGDRIEIGEIGFLYSKNGKVQFEQSREVNLLLAAYGLKTIDFVDFSEKKAVLTKPNIEKKVEKKIIKVLSKVEQEEVTEMVSEKKGSLVSSIKVEENEVKVITLDASEKIENIKETVTSESDAKIIPIKPNKLGTVAKYAIAVCIVPALFYSYWIPMETDALDTGAIQVSDFNPIHNQVERTYKSRISEFNAEEIALHKEWEDLTSGINAQVYNLEYSEDFYVPVQLLKDEDITLKEEVDKTSFDLEPINTSVESNEIISSGNYHVISGCFSIKSNAEKLVADLKSQGFSAQIIDKQGGLHRVSAGGFSSRQEAKNAVESVKSNGFSGWVLKK